MKLTGEIKEDALVNLTELSNISLKNNLISGKLMKFANNPKLRNIDLSSNKFHGEIPQSLLYLNSLEALLLQDNDLTGPIPGFNQSSLKSFNVSQNNLSGEMPQTKTLQSFGLSSYAVERGKLVFVENNQPRFELDDLLKASAEGLGKGNFGNCYKAMLEIGQVVVVKRLIDLKPLSSEEFVRQVRAIANQKHPNLLPLLAYYYSKDEKLFLYRFAAHGNVYNRLHGGRGTRDRIPFRWSSRLAVARGVARALEHLHQNTRSQTTAPHGNLKSSNVLLDENEETLISDYGLTSLIALPIAAQRMVAYKTPEYQSHKLISKKSDVWSYGCLLLELLTGRIPAHSAPPGINGVDLCGWVHRAVREEWTAEIFDPEIAVVRGANQGMLRLMQIAMKCCEKSPEKRPEIRHVLAEVEKVRVSVDSEEEELSHSSLERSLTDDSLSATSTAMVVIADNRR
ncbi:hypothetical protein DH2020_030899 [Rehmannia glutinosa]|uniref:Protein kinase domain-containing protein n=1 Tax=Rehmannia glutinosa TaxID=99300 RepID=A0ABR0VJL6_REHGL